MDAHFIDELVIIYEMWRTTQYQTHKSVLIKLHQIPKLVVFSETEVLDLTKLVHFFFGMRVLLPELFDGFVMDFSFKAQTSYRKQRYGCVPSEKRQLDDDTPKISCLNTIQEPI